MYIYYPLFLYNKKEIYTFHKLCIYVNLFFIIDALKLTNLIFKSFSFSELLFLY